MANNPINKIYIVMVILPNFFSSLSYGTVSKRMWGFFFLLSHNCLSSPLQKEMETGDLSEAAQISYAPKCPKSIWDTQCASRWDADLQGPGLCWTGSWRGWKIPEGTSSVADAFASATEGSPRALWSASALCCLPHLSPSLQLSL